MNPTTIVMPVHSIPVAKRLYKKELELKQIRNFLGPRSRIKLGHLRYYQHQPLDAKIYPNKFLQSHVEEKNPANVSKFPTRPISCCSDDANLRADVSVEAYEYVDDICAFYKSEEEEKSMCITPNVIARLKHGIDKKLRACIVEWLIEAHKLFKFQPRLYILPSIFSTDLWPFVWWKRRKADSRNGIFDLEHYRIKHLSFFFIDLCLGQCGTLPFRPSVLAAAAIYTTHATVEGCKPCSKIYEQLTGCSAQTILKCSRLMLTSHQKARSVRRVYKKYNTRGYQWLARAELARFLLTEFSRARIFIFKLILFLLRDR
ncbi:hypothetical protein NL676_012422 [Syzygium grande]|nr:hypothetical protein NL676_012422 [Syzygium grande]